MRIIKNADVRKNEIMDEVAKLLPKKAMTAQTQM